MARTKKTKGNEININIKFNKDIDIDIHTFSVLQKIKQKYGYTYKQLICAMTLFYEHFENISSEEFLLLNTGMSHINTAAISPQKKDMISPEKEDRHNIVNTDMYKNEASPANTEQSEQTDPEPAEPDLTDADVFDFLSQNEEIFGYNGE